MIETENDCVGCPQGCIHCGRERSYYVWYCDECGKVTYKQDDFIHTEDGKDYCHSCYERSRYADGV